MKHNKEDLDAIQIIDDHLGNFFEEEEVIVFHEIETKENSNHIDVYWINSNKFPDFTILLTCGISRYEMNIPEFSNANSRIELMIILPKDWNLKGVNWKDEEMSWPILHLKAAAKIPYEQNIWIESGHTIAYTGSEEHFPGTKFISSIVLPSISLDEEFTFIKENETQFLTLVPIYEEELSFKLRKGSQKLIERLEKYNINDQFDIDRRNTCKSRFRFW